jgi:hypothetical protein
MTGAGDHEKLKGSSRNMQGNLPARIYGEQLSATQRR